jgi:hypothetical protein
MVAEAGVDVHRGAPRCLLRLFDVAAEDLSDWSEFDAEAECWGLEAHGLSRERLTALFESCVAPWLRHAPPAQPLLCRQGGEGLEQRQG